MVVNRWPRRSTGCHAARLTEACCYPSLAAEHRAPPAGRRRKSRSPCGLPFVVLVRPRPRRSGILAILPAGTLGGLDLPATERVGLEDPLAHEYGFDVRPAGPSLPRVILGLIVFCHRPSTFHLRFFIRRYSPGDACEACPAQPRVARTPHTDVVSSFLQLTHYRALCDACVAQGPVPLPTDVFPAQV